MIIMFTCFLETEPDRQCKAVHDYAESKQACPSH